MKAVAFLLIFTFSVQQLSFAYSSAPTAITAQGVSHDPFFKILRSDPSFTIKDLNQSQLDQIKAKLLTLTTEDIHFGQSAVYALYEMLRTAYGVPSTAEMTGCSSSLDAERFDCAGFIL